MDANILEFLEQFIWPIMDYVCIIILFVIYGTKQEFPKRENSYML